MTYTRLMLAIITVALVVSTAPAQQAVSVQVTAAPWGKANPIRPLPNHPRPTIIHPGARSKCYNNYCVNKYISRLLRPCAAACIWVVAGKNARRHLDVFTRSVQVRIMR